MTDLELTTSVTIDVPATAVWEAITTPELIKQWFFGVDTETDWEVGSPLVHRGEYQGQPYEDKGTILTFDPPKNLVHSHWSPASGVPDEPENYELVAWSLTERDGGTELAIHETNLASEQAKEAPEQGWKAALNNLKEFLESARRS